MAVCCTYHAELVGVRAKLRLEGKANFQRLACIFLFQHFRFFKFRDIEVAHCPGFVVGKFIGGRQGRVCLSVTFYLSHFVERFPLGALLYIGLVNRATGIGFHRREHPAVGHIAVMSYSKGPTTCFVLVVSQPLIEIQGVRSSNMRLSGQRNHLSRPNPVVSQNYIAMQVEAFGYGGPLIADQGREVARLVKMISCLNDPFPDLGVDRRAGRVFFENLLGNLILGKMGNQVERGFASSITTLCKTFSPFLTLRNSHNIRRSILDISCDTHYVGMVSDRQPVERTAQLDRLSARCCNFFTAC